MKTFWVVLGVIVGGYLLSAIDPGGERANARADRLECIAMYTGAPGYSTFEEARHQCIRDGR